MTEAPHYLRFVRAIALITSLTGLPACGSSVVTADSGTNPGMDSGSPTTDSGTVVMADAGSDAGNVITPIDASQPLPDTGVFDCATCNCDFGIDAGSPLPSCDSLGQGICCAAIGPLSPPDLPV